MRFSKTFSFYYLKIQKTLQVEYKSNAFSWSRGPMWPCTCLLLRSPVPHTLACSLDSSVTGSVFVSQIQQASSCFKAIAFSTPSGLKTLPCLFLRLTTSHYSCLQRQPIPSQTSSPAWLCFLFLIAFFLSEMLIHLLVYLLISVPCYQNISTMRAGMYMVCLNILNIQKRVCCILGIQ